MPDPDFLASVAAQLAARVRTDEAEDNGLWLAGEVPQPWDWFRLNFVLAAAVPDDVAWTLLTSWAWREHKMLLPHGTSAAAARHRYHKEALCDLCKASEWQRMHERWEQKKARFPRGEVAA